MLDLHRAGAAGSNALSTAGRVFTGCRLTPFAEVLLGGVRTKTSVALSRGSVSDADTDWGGALGGGIDYHVTGRWSARAGLGLLLLRGEGSWDNDPRLSLGVVYRFGS